MTQYHVHLYREMRLFFPCIEAESPEAAAAIAASNLTADADDVQDCDGENLAALVDVAGDDDYGQSVMIDFEPERQRKAATSLLSALKALLPYAQSECASLFEAFRRDGDPACGAEAERCGKAVEQATAAVAGATVAEPEPGIHAILARRKEIAAVWGVEDVLEIRPDLTENQAWAVLEAAANDHDATIGINWDVLVSHADTLFGDAPDADATAEA